MTSRLIEPASRGALGHSTAPPGAARTSNRRAPRERVGETLLAILADTLRNGWLWIVAASIVAYFIGASA
jgi:hypothetical protein